ncbi:MAG TPA: glycosyltransferase [Methylomirabilota bacterium]|nr:glycosyltransferase [Methylomirabilota bacterium]
MTLIIVHFHLRPGGIRRIIELATPHLVKASGDAIDRIVLAVGEAGDRKWNETFAQLTAPVPVEFFVEAGFNYLSEQKRSPAAVTKRVHAALDRLLVNANSSNTLVWVHNPGIGRNLILTRELVRACDKRGLPLVAHHHDWWFDNRWRRWPEMQRSGFPTLASVARTIFPSSRSVRHFTINHSDVAQLKPHLDHRATWLPNLTERVTPPSEERLREVRAWIQRKWNDRDAPVWILPCRLLRRKNVAEALLLARWLRPEAWLVTTGGVSSADEKAYADKLAAAAHRHHWRLRLGVLAGDEARKPSVAELLAASEAVMLTSIQEGFGLPYLEAAASRRPLIARSLPNIAPDLNQFGFRFPQCYDEVLIAPHLFEWRGEQMRQTKLFEAWRKQLPGACRSLPGRPALLAARQPQPIPFSRLTLTAQLEVLAHPARASWKACAPLNPFLEEWRVRTAANHLRVTPWPSAAKRWLGGDAYGRRFFEALRAPSPARAFAPSKIQSKFIESKLAGTNLFPLLWNTKS